MRVVSYRCTRYLSILCFTFVLLFSFLQLFLWIWRLPKRGRNPFLIAILCNSAQSQSFHSFRFRYNHYYFLNSTLLSTTSSLTSFSTGDNFLGVKLLGKFCFRQKSSTAAAIILQWKFNTSVKCYYIIKIVMMEEEIISRLKR